jgi:hypothetical protein
LPLPAQAQNAKETSKCRTVVQSVKNKITKGRKVEVVKVFKNDISTEYQSYPKNRPFSYSFSLVGAGATSILSSGQLLTSFSRDILTNCTDVSQVIYGIDETDDYGTFGLMSGNKIDAFKCVDPGPYQKRPWGYEVCI